MTAAAPWRPVPGGVEAVAVRVASSTSPACPGGVVGGGSGEDPWLAARVTPPPEDGRANAALVALLAEALEVAPSVLEVVAGTAARRKRVRVAGDDAAPERRLTAVSAVPVGRDRPG